MKHFVVEANYCAPLEQVREAYPRHRAWLQTGYDLGLFLCSGPKDPPVGGYLVARAESMEVLKTMFEEEPLNAEKLATFTFTEFQPGNGSARKRIRRPNISAVFDRCQESGGQGNDPSECPGKWRLNDIGTPQRDRQLYDSSAAFDLKLLTRLRLTVEEFQIGGTGHSSRPMR